MNADETIDRTILSVVSQAGDFRLRYHIQDGGSADGTLERIEGWKTRLRLNNFPRQCHGIYLTFASEQDRGMYDALVKGFASLDADADDFMTWINADDILMPGAIALASALGRQFTKEQLSWFGGAVCIIRNDLVTTSFDRPLPTEALKMGLCDGVHWDYLQQEGTFFRKWLWQAVNPSKTILEMKLAGDWNLWRMMAAKAWFAQVSHPLGGFRISDNQLSTSQHDRYVAEIEDVLSNTERRASMEGFCNDRPVTRLRIETKNFRSSDFRIIKETADHYAQQRYYKVFGKQAPWSVREQPLKKILCEGKDVTPLMHLGFNRIDSDLKRRANFIAFDKDWQFPAITEKHAFIRISTLALRSSSGVIYVAYPWATLIDKLQTKAPDTHIHLDRFEQFCDLLPKDVKKITVCQHIYGRKYVHLFRQAGIEHVFWSHATRDDVDMIRTNREGPYFHPFPLYPVQVAKALPGAMPEADTTPRKYLFSFIGARANQYYLTKARNWILNSLTRNPHGLVLGRDSWHYQKVVYDHQIKGTTGSIDAEKLLDSSAADQFRETLNQSTFSLCPSGSGPNSIRLWESIGAGCIPVILADTWAPPGNPRLWEMAAVFCKEDPEEIKALPDRLAKIAADPEQVTQKRHAMRQIWLLYGPQSFVTDVQEFIQSQTGVLHGSSDATLRDGPKGHLIDVALAVQDGGALLRHCASALLLDTNGTLDRLETDIRLVEELSKARKEQTPGSILSRHYDAVVAYARRKVPKSSPESPAILRKAAPKICLFGRHANRTPLSYEPIRRLIGPRLENVETPEKADIVISGFNIDLRDNVEFLMPVLKRPHKPKFVIISEEPLWDITWSGPFTGRKGRITANGTEITYTFLGHETSDIFKFDRIPYFVLTSYAYVVRYANLIARFTKMAPGDMRERWQKATIPAAFFLEKRNGEPYSCAFPERGVFGLSAYRTEVAEHTEVPGVLRVGKGWSSDARRQDLPDWHLDKLAKLDGRTRILSAFENVHQRLYITEKVFDAFAVGAVPAYWAGPRHRVFDLIPEASMLNCYNLSPREAAETIACFTPDSAFAETWLDTTARLEALFRDDAAIQAERRRVADATLKSLLALV